MVYLLRDRDTGERLILWIREKPLRGLGLHDLQLMITNVSHPNGPKVQVEDIAELKTS